MQNKFATYTSKSLYNGLYFRIVGYQHTWDISHEVLGNAEGTFPVAVINGRVKAYTLLVKSLFTLSATMAFLFFLH